MKSFANMNPEQNRQINALYQGALFVASKKSEKKFIEGLMNMKSSTFEEMALDFKVYFHWKMMTDQNSKALIEIFFRCYAIDPGVIVNWRL